MLSSRVRFVISDWKSDPFCVKPGYHDSGYLDAFHLRRRVSLGPGRLRLELVDLFLVQLVRCFDRVDVFLRLADFLDEVRFDLFFLLFGFGADVVDDHRRLLQDREAGLLVLAQVLGDVFPGVFEEVLVLLGGEVEVRFEDVHGVDERGVLFVEFFVQPDH